MGKKRAVAWRFADQNHDGGEEAEEEEKTMTTA
jgi:hypothetical protein